MARTRHDKNVIKHDWSGPANESFRQDCECRTPPVAITDPCSGVPSRAAGLEVNFVECLPTSTQEIQLGVLDAAIPCSPKGLGSIASQLFNLEPRTGPEKPLDVGLGLYQMEKR